MSNFAKIKNKFYEEKNIFFRNYLDSLKENGNDSYIFVEQNIEKLFSNIWTIRKNRSDFLLFGDVQSGKTNNIYGSLMKFLDTNVDIIIFLSGITNMLLKQSNNRSPLHNFVQQGEVNFFESKNFKYIRNENKKIVIYSLKNYKHLDMILSELKGFNLQNKKIVIIDDECDYATSSKKEISSLIDEIRNLFVNSIYLGVTATPFSNFLVDSFDKIIIMEKSKNYTGIDFFNQNQQKYYDIVGSDKKNEESWYKAIKIGIKKYILNTFLNYILYDKRKSQILFNISQKKIDHKKIEIDCKQVIKDLRENFGAEMIEIVDEIWEVKKWEKEKIEIKSWVDNFLEGLYTSKIAILNSDEFNVDEYEKVSKGQYKMVIGGYMMSRGFTFEELCVEVLLNGKKVKNSADTILQRARWLGYRNKEYKISIVMNNDLLNAYIDSEEILSETKKILNSNFYDDDIKLEKIKEVISSYEKTLATGKKGEK